MVKNLPAKAGDMRDMGSIPKSSLIPGGGNEYPSLENSMVRGIPGRLESMRSQGVFNSI